MAVPSADEIARRDLNRALEIFRGDPRRALGLAPGATALDVRRAFNNLAKRYHPARFAQRDPAVVRLANEVFLALRDAQQAVVAELPPAIAPASTVRPAVGGPPAGAPARVATVPLSAASVAAAGRAPIVPPAPTTPPRPPMGPPTQATTARPPIIPPAPAPRPPMGPPTQATTARAPIIPPAPAPRPPMGPPTQATTARAPIIPPAPAPRAPIIPPAPTAAARPAIVPPAPAPRAPIVPPAPTAAARPPIVPPAPAPRPAASAPAPVLVEPGPPRRQRPSSTWPGKSPRLSPAEIKAAADVAALAHDRFERALDAIRHQRWTEARAELEQLAAEAPADPRYRAYLHYVQGWAAFQLGRDGDARAEWHRALACDPGLGLARWALESTGVGH